MADVVRPGGARRIDRVLADGFLDGLPTLPLDEVRALRDEAEQEEVDLSYLRKLLQARLDLARGEIAQRAAGHGTDPEGDLVAALPTLLAEERAPAHGLGRHSTVQPSRADAHRREVEALVHDAGLSDPAALDDEGVAAAVARFEEEERAVSAQRRAVQGAMDACSAEITRRYRDGSADVAAVLARAQGH